MRIEATKSNIHAIARGLLIQNDEIILCRSKSANWFFLPGGHIEDGESARNALSREIKEEIGIDNFEIVSPIGICENTFPIDEGKSQHEINIIFEVKIAHALRIKSKEYHIEFMNIKVGDFKNFNILPASLKDGILEWLESGKLFFKEI